MSAPDKSHCVKCGATPTVDSHIIPAAFFKLAKKGSNHLVSPGPRGAPRAKTQKGLFDSTILCAACDNEIGTIDKYAVEYCRDFKTPESTQSYQTINLPYLDIEKFKRFAVSVIWRASISSLGSFSEIRLGPFQDVAQKIVFGALPPDDCSQLHVQVNLLTHESMAVSSFVTYPVQCRNENGQYFIFLAGGFQFLVRFGSIPFASPRYNAISDELALSSTKLPTGVIYPFEEAGEFEIVRLSKVWRRR